MKTALVSAESLVRVRERGLLLSAFEKETILTRINILDDGCFNIETEDWDSYWQPLYELDHGELEENLCELHLVWRDYINADFNSSLMQAFCFHYFSGPSYGLLARENNPGQGG